MQTSSPILILGGGINGAAVARELALNSIPSCIVDKHDICFGATSKSSRLIHGGLRYLEYADFKLVGESLRERNRLAKNGPQFVKPLRLHIPVGSRFHGFSNAFSRFMNLSRFPALKPVSRWLESSPERGLYVIRTGLKMYDSIAANDQFPAHEVHSVGEAGIPPVDSHKYKWVCSYYDGQMWAVERFVISMLEDTRILLKEKSLEFNVYPHHQVELDQGKVRVLNQQGECVKDWEPSLIINATGAWGDLTLEGLEISSPPSWRDQGLSPVYQESIFKRGHRK
ncbi:MAG: FAD-dependent oxidoreductase [Planctomycetaceae bacterium]